MKIILATKNEGKFIELSKALKIPGIEFLPFPKSGVPDFEETESSYEGNALLKAKIVLKATGIPTIADDSGLSIDALDGFPGLYSARCAGPEATEEDKINLILSKMDGIENRSAKFICGIAYAEGFNGGEKVFRGICEGEILIAPKGESKPGLQYDRIFYFPLFRRTFAELENNEKEMISHRGKATLSMKQFLIEKLISANKSK